MSFGQAPSFRRVRWREGYSIEEVDAFVDRVTEALRSASPSIGPDDITGVTFAAVRLREGYSMQDVDEWLDQAESALRDHQPD